MSILNNIGNTQLVEIRGVKVKLEYLNPSGSVKDRIVKYIVEYAERRGLLKRGYTLVEASTGNTGIAVSFVGAVKGYKVHIFIPKGLSKERLEIMKALGAKVTLVKKDCVSCAINKVKNLAKRPKNFHINQFENPLNVEENEKFLGREILDQTEMVDCFVAGVDPSVSLLKLNKSDKKTIGIAEWLPFKDNSFDYVISITAIHNFANIKKSIDEMKRVGRKMFVFSVLKKSKKANAIKSLIAKSFKIGKIIEEGKDAIFFCQKSKIFDHARK